MFTHGCFISRYSNDRHSTFGDFFLLPSLVMIALRDSYRILFPSVAVVCHSLVIDKSAVHVGKTNLIKNRTTSYFESESIQLDHFQSWQLGFVSFDELIINSTGTAHYRHGGA